MAESNDSGAHGVNAAAAQGSSASGAANEAAQPDEASAKSESNSEAKAENQEGDGRNSGALLPIVLGASAAGAAAGDFEYIGDNADAPPQPRQWRRHVPLAAGLALAVTVGALAGAGATAGLLRDAATPPPAAPAAEAASISVEVLRANVARLEEELAALKAGLGSAQRSASAQLGKLAERLDRAEKAHPASDITGSVPAAKPASQPPLAEGWRLRDYYAGRAVVESRATGRLFEVGPGSNLPGLGRVETIKRQDGHVTVVTRNGIISASLEPRRPPYYLPYRY